MERDDLCAALGEDTAGRVLSALKKRGLLQMEPQGSPEGPGPGGADCLLAPWSRRRP